MNYFNRNILFSLLLVVLPSIPWSSSGEEIKKIGQTYPIVEKNASDEMKEIVRGTNWQEEFSKNNVKQKLESFKPDEIISLPRAPHGSVRLINMEYTLEFDIPDAKGNVIYPKGYTFNPLDFMTYTKTIIVINGSDTDQVKWFKASPYFTKTDVMTIITDGDYMVLSAEFNQPIFYLTKKVQDRFQLKVVPSVVRQKDKYMEVTEIEIKRDDTSYNK